MFHYQGKPWRKWNAVMRDQLTKTQARDGHERGSWGGEAADVGAGRGGRLYTTALSALILETYYRHPWIYRKLKPEVENQDE
jgi:hypothetical protein